MGNSQLSMSAIQNAVKVSALCAALNWLILRFPVVLNLFPHMAVHGCANVR